MSWQTWASRVGNALSAQTQRIRAVQAVAMLLYPVWATNLSQGQQNTRYAIHLSSECHNTYVWWILIVLTRRKH